MLPIDPEGIPGRAVIYAKDQPQYRPLPARLQRLEVTPSGGGSTAVYTRWRLTLRERLAVLFLGRNIDIEMMTFDSPLQPMQVSVERMGVEPEEESK